MGVKYTFSPIIYTNMPANNEIHQRILIIHLCLTDVNENSKCVSLVSNKIACTGSLNRVDILKF